jgi:hypothetical protein
MAEEDDAPSIEWLIQELSSSRLDASSPLKRKQVIQAALERISEDENDRQALAELQGASWPHNFLRRFSTKPT